MKEMRPTAGRVFLALFNILGPLEGLSFLDLFSGSGKIAAEAFRRGAYPVCAVESDRKRHCGIMKNVPDGVECLCMDARRAVARFAKRGAAFDVIFADPPYELGWGREFPALLEACPSVLADGGAAVLEHSSGEELLELPAAEWSREDRAYGGSVLTFYRKVIAQ